MGTYAGAEEEGEDKGTTEMKCYELTTIPNPHSPSRCCSGGGGRRIESKVEPGKKGEVRGFVSISHYPILFNCQ